MENNCVYLVEIDKYFGKHSKYTKRSIQIYGTYTKAAKYLSNEKRSFELWLIRHKDYAESFRKYEKFTSPARGDGLSSLTITETVHLYQPEYILCDTEDIVVTMKLIKTYVK